MVSAPHGDLERLDPTNTYLHRMNVRRLEAEAIRDTLVAASGRLTLSMYGKSTPVHLTSFMEGRGRPGQSGPLDGDGRRSLYLNVRRNFFNPMFLAFDTPAPFSTMGRRNVSNVPAQALTLMNDPLVVSQARLWAEWAAAETGRDHARLDDLFETAFSRPADRSRSPCVPGIPRPSIASSASESGADRPGQLLAWADLCHVIINMKEFIFMTELSLSHSDGSCRRFTMHCGHFCYPGLSRRDLLLRSGAGFRALAATALFREPAFGARIADATSKPAPKPARRALTRSLRNPRHFPAKARSVIFLFMDGGPSQVDTFDPKPRLDREHGEPIKVKTHPTQFNNVGNVHALSLEIPQLWRERYPGERPVSACWPVCRRLGNHPVDGVQFLRAYDSQLFSPHRQRPAGSAQSWRVDHVWAGERVPEPAGFCGAQWRLDSPGGHRLFQ